MGGLVAFPAMRNRRQKGAVGLDQQPIEWHHLRHFLQLERPRKRDDPGQREIETHLEAALRHLAVAREAVEHAANIAGVLLVQNRNVSSSASRVWMTIGRRSFPRKADLLAEHLLLHVAG